MGKLKLYEAKLKANFDRLYPLTFERCLSDLLENGVNEDLAETRAHLAAEASAYDEAIRQTEAQLAD